MQYRTIDRRKTAADNASVVRRLAEYGNRQGQVKTVSADPAASASAQNADAQTYYTPREYGAQSQTLESRVTSAQKDMQERATALEQSRKAMEGLYAQAGEKRQRYYELKGSFVGDDAASYDQRLLDEWTEAMDLYEQSQREYQMAYDAYKPFEDEYNAAVTAYNEYQAQEQAAYNQWRSTIRDADAIRQERSDIQGKRAELERLMKENNRLNDPGQISYGANALGRDAAIAGNEIRIRELQEYLGDIGERERLLEEELEYSQKFYFDGLRQQGDFAEKSRFTGADNAGDRLYQHINGNRNAGAWTLNGIAEWAVGTETGMELLGVNDTPSYLEYMKPGEVEVFNYLYNTQGKKEAQEYLDFIKTDLTARQTEHVTGQARELARKNPNVAKALSALSVPLSLAGGVRATAGQIGAKLRGEELDPNAVYNLTSNVKNAIRDETAKMIEESLGENWGPVGSFFYGTGMSMADMVTDALAGGSSIGTMAIIGNRSFSEAVIDGKNRGLSDKQALTLGLSSAAAELLTERLGVDETLKLPKKWGEAGFWKGAFKGAAGEAGEEGLTNLANLVADISISGDKSEFVKNTEGYKEDGYDPVKAYLLALKDAGISLGLDAAGGAISGSVFGGVDGRRQKRAAGKTQQKTETAADGAAKTETAADGAAEPGTEAPEGEAAPVAGADKEPEAADEAELGQGTQPARTAEGIPVDNTGDADGMTLEEIRKAAVNRRNPLISKVMPTAQIQDEVRRLEKADTLAQVTGIDLGVSREKIDQADRLGKLVGKEIYFFSENPTEYGTKNGQYGVGSGRIGINIKSNNVMAATFGHELTHSVEVADSYQDLKDLVFQRIRQTGEDLDHMRRSRQELYERNGVQTNQEMIDREIVAKYVEEHLLTDEKSIRKMATDNRNVAMRILGWLDSLWAKVAKTRGSQERAFIRNAREIYRAALQEADAVSRDRARQSELREQMHDAYRRGDDEEADARFEELYADRPEGMLEDPDYNEGSRRYSLGDGDDYSTGGIHWAIEHGILGKGEIRAAWEAVANVEKRGYNYPETIHGEKFVSSGNYLMVMDTDYRNPSIRTIFEFSNQIADPMDYAKELIIDAAGDETELQDAYRTIENLFGEGHVVQYDRESYGSASGKNRGGKGKSGGRNSQNDNRRLKRQDSAFSFGGENAANIDREALAQAKQMRADGEEMADIFRETGWYVGADGKWRFEIDDSQAKYRPGGDAQFRKDHPEYARFKDLERKFIDGDITDDEIMEMAALRSTWGGEHRRLSELVQRGNARLANVLEHDALFEQYPQLRRVKVRFGDTDDAGAWWDEGRNEIVISEQYRQADPAFLELKLLHEIQHAIQDIEGFARGSSPEYWGEIQNSDRAIRENDRELAKAEREAQAALEGIPPEVAKDFWYAANMWENDPEGAQEISDRLESSEYWEAFMDYAWAIGTIQELMEQENPKRTAKDLYRNTAGEIEARNAANRRGLDAGARKNRLPNTGDERTVFVEGSEKQYSIEMDATEDERYNELKDRTITAIRDHLSEKYAEDIAAIDALPDRAKSKVEKIIRPLATKLGILNRTMRTPELEIDFNFSTGKGLNESLSQQLRYGGRYADFAKVLIHLDEVLRNAVLIERHSDKYKGTEREDRNLKMTHVLVGLFAVEDGIIPVQMEIKEKLDTVGKLYMTVAMTKIEADVMGSTIGQDRARSLLPASMYSLADIFAKINPNDAHFLKYVPDEFLSPLQINAKRLALEADIRRISSYARKQYSISEPEESGSNAYSDEELAEIEALRNRASMEEDGTEERAAWVAVEPERFTGTVKQHYDGTLRQAVNTLAKSLNVPRVAKRDFLKPIAEELGREYMEKGTVSADIRDRLFDTAWNEGRNQEREFYDTYKEVKDYLRTTAITLGEEDRDSRDWKDFQRRAFGTLKIKNEGGLPVDTAWGELREMAPELFPEDIYNPADMIQHMLEVGRSIKPLEQTNEEYYGPDAEQVRELERMDFDAAIQRTITELWKVKRLADERIAETTPVAGESGSALTQEEVTAMYPRLKDARKAVEKATAKNILTKRDKEQIQRLLRHDIQPEHLDPTRDNVEGILAVWEAKKAFEEIAEPIREWNRQQKAANYRLAENLLAGVRLRDKKRGFMYSRETMSRNIRDIVKDPEAAERIIQTYFKPVQEASAEAIRIQNKYRDRVQALELSRKVKKGDTVSEAYAVQFYGEVSDILKVLQEQENRLKKPNPARLAKRVRDGKTYEEWQSELRKLWEENPGLDRGKIEDAAREFGRIYEELFEQMNEVRVRNGYEPINHRSGYFPHFQREGRDGIMAQFGKALGIDVEVQQLPTTINGLTHTFRPGIQWFGNALERKGVSTAYDAVEGFDRYVTGASDVICHTDNIQRLRALANQIRYRTSDEGIREQIRKIQERTDISEDEKDTLIRERYESGKFELSNFVVELDEYTNLLANKKSRADRNMEQAMGRDMYNVVKNLESRVAANMVAINPGSWLTNFIPITQGWSCLGSRNLLSGMMQTLKAMRADDGMVDRSDFLTGRKGTDALAKTWAQEWSGKLSHPMEIIDGFTAGSLIRARYQQNLQQGLSEAEALSEADSWAADVMADRTKGAMPTVFHRSNPLTKLFTQFQLEVNNQLSYVWKDIPREKRDKGVKELALALLKFAIGAWLYNEAYEFFLGRRPALDPIGMVGGFVSDLADPELDFADAALGLGGNIAENTPFIGGLLGGGRVPISSALPDVTNLVKAVGNSDWSTGKRLGVAAKELAKPLLYIAPPFGGGQIKKVWEGLSMIAKGGSYTLDAEGNPMLQYPLYSTRSDVQKALEAGQAMIFGKTTIRSGREWVDGGFGNLSAEQTATYQALISMDVEQADAFELLTQLREAEKTDDQSRTQIQRDILRNSGLEGDALATVYYDLFTDEDSKERAMLDELLDDGADMGKVTHALMNIKDADATLTGAEGSCAKRDILRNSGLTDDQKRKIYRTMISESWDDEMDAFTAAGMGVDDFLEVQNAHARIKEQYEDEGDMATAFARWVNQQSFSASQKNVIRDSFKYWQMMPAQASRYDKATDAGLDDETAFELASDLEALEPPEGKTSVQDIQKWRVAIDNAWSNEQQLQMLQAAGMTGKTYDKVAAAWNAGIAPAAWVRAQELRGEFDADGNGSLTNEDWTKLIDSMTTYKTVLPGDTTTFHLTLEQKGYLWQMLTGSKSTKNNPYSVAGGEKWLKDKSK